MKYRKQIEARYKIDVAITRWLELHGMDQERIAELDFSQIDEALNDLFREANVYKAPFMEGIEESLDKLTIRKEQ